MLTTRPVGPTARVSIIVRPPDPVPASSTVMPGPTSAQTIKRSGVLRIQNGRATRHLQDVVGEARPEHGEEGAARRLE